MLSAQLTPRTTRPAIRSGFEPLGRAAAVALAVVPAVLLTGDGTRLHRAVVAAALTAIWFTGLNAGFAASRTTLAALGTRVAVVRGALLGLVLTAAVGYWIPSFGVGAGMTFAIAGLVLVFVSGWEMLSRRVRRRRRGILLVGPRDACTELMRELSERTRPLRS